MHFYISTFLRFFFAFFCCVIGMNSKLVAQHFTTVKTDEGVEISENGKKVLFYQQRPKSLNGKYERADYVHPLYSLNENVLTEDFPDDHPHHRGIFWAWHQIILNDKNIADGWTCENIYWSPVNLKVKKRKETVSLQSEVIWKSVLLSNESTPIIKENTKITVYKLTSQYRIIDFDIQLFALVNNLKIGGSDDDKGYGGFSLRLKLPKNILFISNNKVITPGETAVTTGPWLDFTGSFDKEDSPKCGVAVFCNPANPGSQKQWILRKEASMQNIPYPGRTPITLSRRGLRLIYRVIIHNGNMSNDDLEKLYQQYIHK